MLYTTNRLIIGERTITAGEFERVVQDGVVCVCVMFLHFWFN